ncbi:MAG: antitoxin, Phd family protein [Burkholderiales bacterium PBB5]|nr:MAG: antitoxin, Phd family protein [Burkholderiales bacterium PBB5]
MRFSTQVKSISTLKANAAEILQTLSEEREPILITQNGEAKAVLQDVVSYEEMQETLALLKLLALGERDVEEGRVTPVDEAFASVRAKLRQNAKR